MSVKAKIFCMKLSVHLDFFPNLIQKHVKTHLALIYTEALNYSFRFYCKVCLMAHHCRSLELLEVRCAGGMLGAFHLEKKSGNFGENFREFPYGKKLFHFYACVEVRVA